MAAKKPGPERFPPEYGLYLERLAKSISLSRKDIASEANLEYQTVYRNLTGQPQRSLLGAAAIRKVLVDHGLEVAPVPVGEDTWTEPTNAAEVPLTGAAETFRRNLVQFREQAGYPDLHEGSRASGVPFETLRAYELGQSEISGPHLLALASAYGRNAAEFEDAHPTQGKAPTPSAYLRTVGSLEDMSPKNRDRLLELERELAAIRDDERKRAAATAAKAPKRKGR